MTRLNAIASFVLIASASLLISTVCWAEEIPAALRGKSVALNWTDARTVRDATGRQKSLTQTSEMKLYLSDQGRVFSRFDRSTGQKDAKTVAQVSGAADNYLHWSFEGGSLVADQHFKRGARRVVIGFRDGFRGCSVNVLHGKEAGTEAIHYTGYNDNVDYEIIAISVTASSCSVQPGNVFANPQ